MKSKKGVISVQFNWVFILIAGVLILLFFGSLVLKMRSASDTSIAETIMTNMQTIMTGAEVSVRTINPIEIPNTEIRFSCDSMSVGTLSTTITKNKIVFSPTVIKGRKLLAWALDWNSPYHVTNFLYLTTPNIKYVFVKPTGGDYATGLYDLLPDEINKIIVDDISEITNTGNYFRLIFFNGPPEVPPALISAPNNEVSAINVDISSNKITFYKKKGSIFDPVDDSTYLGDPMLLGALFSQDIDDYNCNLKKAFNKLNIVTQIYKKRTEVLAAESGCSSYYDPGPFSSIITYSEGDNINIDGIKGNIETIKKYNKYLQSESCPTLY